MNRIVFLIALLLPATGVLGQVRFSAATDSLVYHYGDAIHITITASNPGNVPDTLVFPTTLQAEYFIDNLEVNSPASNLVTEVFIPPHGSVNWDAPYLPPYPLNSSTLTLGKHAIVAQVGQYWTSETMWITVDSGLGLAFHASTDSSIYHYGDSIHLSVTAANPGVVPTTLSFSSSLAVNYFLDDFSLLSVVGSLPSFDEPIIPAHDSITWNPPAYPVNIDTLSPGRHAVVAQVIGYWTSDTMWITVDSGAAMEYRVRTDSSTYHYGDSIHVTLSAVNIGSEPDTLHLCDCDLEYIIDNFNLFGHRPCALTIVPYVIRPGDSLTWSSLPPYPVTKDTLTTGKHAVVGEFIGYGISDTLWVSVANLTAIRRKEAAGPAGYVLENAYPDPFNPSTTIGYRLPVRSHVVLAVYDVLGRKVATLVDQVQNPGVHSVSFLADRLPSGVYFDRLEAGTFTASRKILLLK